MKYLLIIGICLYSFSVFAGDYSVEDLLGMDQAELDQVYLRCGSARLPDGAYQGKAMLLPGSSLNKASVWLAGFVWQGKTFDRERGTLINRIVGFEAAEGRFYHSKSEVDGRISVVIDYKHTSVFFKRVHDELREVSPGLYLGRAYYTPRCATEIMAVNFILDFQAKPFCKRTFYRHRAPATSRQGKLASR